jgi:hypothetical protein
MEAIYFSETSVDFQRTTRRYIPEGNTPHNDRCENPKSYKYFVIYAASRTDDENHKMNCTLPFYNKAETEDWSVSECLMNSMYETSVLFTMAIKDY